MAAGKQFLYKICIQCQRQYQYTAHLNVATNNKTIAFDSTPMFYFSLIMSLSLPYQKKNVSVFK